MIVQVEPMSPVQQAQFRGAIVQINAAIYKVIDLGEDWVELKFLESWE